MHAYPPDFVVIGESTELNIARGGRGRAEIHLQTIGIPSHSSSPHLGRNAVLDMMKVVGALEGLELPSDPLMGPAILALTDIVSEPYPGNSVIPSVCKVTYDRRLLPGETEEGVLDEVRSLSGIGDVRLMAEIGVGDYQAWTGALLHATKFFPAWSLPAEDAFVRTSLSALTLSGLQPELSAYRFCINAAYSAGTAGVPTIGFGPGSEADAHVTDERLRLQDLFAAAEGYAAIIKAVLGS
jgi:putative selenium metabolism hydrolase